LGDVALKSERHSARMSNIINGGYTSMAKCEALMGSAVKWLME